jgi:hypothetical protein
MVINSVADLVGYTADPFKVIAPVW